MTTIPINPALPDDLPPLPVGALAACTLDLLQEAAGLPQPGYITIYQPTQAVAVQFSAEDGARAVARWAQHFGSVVTSQPGTGADTGTWCITQFDFYGVEVWAYTHTLPVTETGSPAGHTPRRNSSAPAN